MCEINLSYIWKVIGEYHNNLGITEDFLNRTPEQEKLIIKLVWNLGISIHQNDEKQVVHWESIFSIHISNKGLVSWIYNDSYNQ